MVGTGAGGAPLLATLAAAGPQGRRPRGRPELRARRVHAGRDRGASRSTGWTSASAAARPRPRSARTTAARASAARRLHWGAFTPRPDERDLQAAVRRPARASDWPVDHAELIGYIEEVEHFVGVSGPADYPWDPSRSLPDAPGRAQRVGRHDDPRLRGPRHPRDRRPRRPRHAATGTRSTSASRPACVGCGSCHQGCRSGAKASMDTTLPADGRRERGRDPPRVDGARASSSTTAGEVSAVVYARDGVDHRQRSTALFLCARRRRDAAPAAAHRPREQQRPGRPQLHGPRRHPGLGPLRHRDARLPRLPVVDHHRRHRAARGRRLRRRLPDPEPRRRCR